MTYRHNGINKTLLDIDTPVLESLTFVYWPFFFVFPNFYKHICTFRTLPIPFSFSAPKTMLKRNCRPQDIASDRESLSGNLSPPKQHVLWKFEKNFFLFLHRKKENIKTKRGDSIVELLQAKKSMSISKSFRHSKYEMTLDTAVPASWNIARSSLPAGGETFRERNEASGSDEKRLYYSLVGRDFFFASIATSLL